MLQLWDTTYRMRARITISAVIGILAGFLCLVVMTKFHQGAADFGWSIHLAQRFLAGKNPYDTPNEQYPFPAALFGMPFVHMRPEIAASIFWGLSSFLLALGLTSEGYHRVLVFLAYPYWLGLLTAQWSTIIMASAFFPLLLPVTLAKPQVGLPVFFTRLSRRGVVACLIVALLSFALLPRWPWLWLGQTGYYQHFFAILIVPGPLVLLALLRYRDRDAWLLVLTSLMPQRWFFDSFILWLIPKSRRAIIVTVALSWCAGIWRAYHPPTSFNEVGRWIVLSTYLPMLAIVLFRKPEAVLQPESAASI
jgi:hypothetical protein